MRRNIILSVLILSIALLFTSCDSTSDNGVATIKVQGTVVSSDNTRASDRSLEMMANIEVNGTPLSINDFKNANGILTPGSNQELIAKVEVPSSKVTLSVEPKEGFIFDEWEFDRRATPRLSWKERREIEAILDPIDENETIEVPTKYTKYIRATYDRGYYVTLSTNGGNGKGTKDNPFTIGELEEELDKTHGYWFDDELTIKVTGNGKLELSQFKNLEEIKIIGYDNAVITTISLPSLKKDFELEIRDVTIETLNAEILPTNHGDDAEIEFENVIIKSLENTDNKTFANMNVELIANPGGTFVNSVLPYYADTTYYHSLIITNKSEDVGNVVIKGKNNIVVVDTLPTKNDDNNLYITREEYNKDPSPWKVDPSIVKNKVIKATALDEDKFPEYIEDFIEEDAFGRDRPEEDDGMPVSYGPYEYQDWDD